MGYGDLQFLDIVVFAAIAVFLVFRLRKVLGRRTGLEKNPNKEQHQNEQLFKNIKEEKNIPELDDNIKELTKAYEVLDFFDHKEFLSGATTAFETIINTFNNGDKKTLRKLLTNEVRRVFEQAIDDKKVDPDIQILSLNIEKVEKVTFSKDKIIIQIKFVSEQFSNNDESIKVKKEDYWSFEKSIKSRDPNWLLCST